MMRPGNKFRTMRIPSLDMLLHKADVKNLSRFFAVEKFK